MKIDFSQMQTKEARAAEEVAERKELAREECARRINAQISAVGQVNIAADYALGLLDEAGMAAFRSWRVWVAAMRGAWRGVAASDAVIGDDANWPPVPPDIGVLTTRG